MAWKAPPNYKNPNSQSRTFQFVAYPESMPDDVNLAIAKFNLDKAAYILHDSDFDDEGNLKKPHYHIYIKCKNPCRVSTVADRFGIKYNQILAYNKIDTPDMIDYWLHENDEKKTLYEPDKIQTFGCTVGDLRKGKSVKQKEDEVAMVRKCMQIVKEMISEGNYDNFELIERCCAAGCYPAYRRDSSIRRYLENASIRASASGASFKDLNAFMNEVSSDE